jgi:hypothetical protein
MNLVPFQVHLEAILAPEPRTTSVAPNLGSSNRSPLTSLTGEIDGQRKKAWPTLKGISSASFPFIKTVA